MKNEKKNTIWDLFSFSPSSSYSLLFSSPYSLLPFPSYLPFFLIRYFYEQYEINQKKNNFSFQINKKKFFSPVMTSQPKIDLLHFGGKKNKNTSSQHEFVKLNKNRQRILKRNFPFFHFSGF